MFVDLVASWVLGGASCRQQAAVQAGLYQQGPDWAPPRTAGGFFVGAGSAGWDCCATRGADRKHAHGSQCRLCLAMSAEPYGLCKLPSFSLPLYAHEVLRMPLPSTLGPGIRSSYVSSCVCCTALWLVVCMHTMQLSSLAWPCCGRLIIEQDPTSEAGRSHVAPATKLTRHACCIIWQMILPAHTPTDLQVRQDVRMAAQGHVPR